VPLYFLDPRMKRGDCRNLRKIADSGPLVALAAVRKAVARFIDGQGKPKVKYAAGGLQFLFRPVRIDLTKAKQERSLSRSGFRSELRPRALLEWPVTDEEGRCTFPALIPGHVSHQLMNKLDDWSERDFSVKPGETLQLLDIVIP